MAKTAIHTHLHPSPHLLLDGEHAIISVRTHIKVLFGRFLISALLATIGILVMVVVNNTTARLIIGGITLVIILAVLAAPVLRWFSWTYTLTNVRLIEQRGVVKRTGRVIPLSRINDVAFEKDLNDRILGCGTLIVHDASEQQGLRLIDIPHIEMFHRTISSLVLEAHGQNITPQGMAADKGKPKGKGKGKGKGKDVPDGDV